MGRPTGLTFEGCDRPPAESMTSALTALAGMLGAVGSRLAETRDMLATIEDDDTFRASIGPPVAPGGSVDVLRDVAPALADALEAMADQIEMLRVMIIQLLVMHVAGAQVGVLAGPAGSLALTSFAKRERGAPRRSRRPADPAARPEIGVGGPR
ncbi:hypothetical protein BJF78_14385 [Pseudonocardia sp. CNS-139]|nr:hypothetical protein BJF78_14385 [Pseudonocardia sp. CNS-139]